VRAALCHVTVYAEASSSVRSAWVDVGDRVWRGCICGLLQPPQLSEALGGGLEGLGGAKRVRGRETSLGWWLTGVRVGDYRGLEGETPV
jgi:hypothetical protein